MNIETSLNKLYALHRFGVKLGLESITKLLDYLGNPERNLKTFHIAGSNGKGSTSSFIASILTEAGYKTGLYTSPHLVKFNERVRINGKEIPDRYIMDFMKSLDYYIDKNQPTFFELTTALAFLYFSESGTDFTVVETGLGGRLDATNTLVPLASVITSISREHTNILGSDIHKIAREKGGIIKKGLPVFVGKVPSEAKDVLLDLAKERNSPFYSLEEKLEDKGDYLRLNTENKKLSLYSAGLTGKYQLYNSALAFLTLAETLKIKEVKIFNSAIKNLIKNTGLQGRYEIYSDSPRIIFDSAHNPESVFAFITAFEENDFNKYKNKLLIFSAKSDKDPAEMLRLLSPYFDKILLTSFTVERAFTGAELKKIADEMNINSEILENPGEYIMHFSSSGNKDCLVILGSMYLLGEIKSFLNNKKNLTF